MIWDGKTIDLTGANFKLSDIDLGEISTTFDPNDALILNASDTSLSVSPENTNETSQKTETKPEISQELITQQAIDIASQLQTTDGRNLADITQDTLNTIGDADKSPQEKQQAVAKLQNDVTDIMQNTQNPANQKLLEQYEALKKEHPELESIEQSMGGRVQTILEEVGSSTTPSTESQAAFDAKGIAARLKAITLDNGQTLEQELSAIVKERTKTLTEQDKADFITALENGDELTPVQKQILEEPKVIEEAISKLPKEDREAISNATDEERQLFAKEASELYLKELDEEGIAIAKAKETDKGRELINQMMGGIMDMLEMVITALKLVGDLFNGEEKDNEQNPETAKADGKITPLQQAGVEQETRQVNNNGISEDAVLSAPTKDPNNIGNAELQPPTEQPAATQSTDFLASDNSSTQFSFSNLPTIATISPEDIREFNPSDLTALAPAQIENTVAASGNGKGRG